MAEESEGLSEKVELPGQSFISDHKGLKRAALLWSSASLATFLVVNHSGDVTVFGTTVSAGNVSVLRFVLSVVSVFYAFEFILSFMHSWYRNSAIKSQTAEGKFEEAARQLEFQIAKVSRIGDESTLRPALRRLDTSLQNFPASVQRAFKEHLSSLSPNARAAGIKNFTEGLGERIEARAVRLMKSQRDAITKRLQKIDLMPQRFSDTASQMRQELRDFVSQARRISGQTVRIERFQFFVLDAGSVVLLVAISLLFSLNPSMGSGVVNWLKTTLPSSGHMSGNVDPTPSKNKIEGPPATE